MRRPLAAAAIAVAAALSFVWYFGSPLQTTPGFFIDESSIAYNAWSIAQGGVDEHGVRMPVYFAAFGEYKNPVYIYLLALVFKGFGPSILAARALSIVLGFLAAVCLALLARDVPARAFTFLAAIATPWLFETSRLVFEVAAFPLALALALLCVRTQRHPVLCALGFALVTYTYTAGRFLGPAMAVALLLVMPWRRALIAWGAYAVLLIPALLNFRALTARVAEVGLAKPSYFAAFSPGFLFVTGDANPRHHIAFGGMLLVTVGLAALVGIGAAIRSRDPWSRYLLAMLVLTPVPGALAPEAPHALRLVALGVVLVVFAGIGVSTLATIPREALRAALTIALFLALAAEGLAFRAQYRELGPLRVDDFDAAYPYAFSAALRMQKPPLCVEESPYYIHAYWYGVLHGVDRAQLPRADEGTEPRGRVCVGSAPVCASCRVLTDARGFVAYRRE
ncbi:MAG TPA: hypothetical protein VF432_05335 [Thermoanaerobaculia bacterium]